MRSSRVTISPLTAASVSADMLPSETSSRPARLVASSTSSTGSPFRRRCLSTHPFVSLNWISVSCESRSDLRSQAPSRAPKTVSCICRYASESLNAFYDSISKSLATWNNPLQNRADCAPVGGNEVVRCSFRSRVCCEQRLGNLGRKFHEPVDLEVPVESECRIDLQALHDGEGQ